jgi:murein DD-endopeptidase MepM/ murein hydrolase activator NlpD
MAFIAPVGSVRERGSGVIWPGRWVDATGYAKLYSLGYHTGADLNLNYPYWDSDRHAGVYAIGDGTVTYAQIYSTQVWGAIIVIDHGLVDNKPCFSRYAHVESILVAKNQVVHAGDQIASVGNGEGLFPYHLHFDISLTTRLRDKPGDWPGTNLGQVTLNYVNPKEWLQARMGASGSPGGGAPGGGTPVPVHDWYVVAALGLRIRKNHGLSGTPVDVVSFGTKVTLEDQSTVDEDSYKWGKINGGLHNGDWIAMGKSEQSETYLSLNQPGNP